MTNVCKYALAAVVLFSSVRASAGRPDEGKYPNLVKSWEAIQAAKGHVQKAEANHAKAGTLGGHGANAVKSINAAEVEIDQAVMFAETHRKPGAPGVVTPKPPLTARPDDVKYPNLGDARLQIEWAIRHIEDAMQYHGPIGSLGGHGERAVEHLRHALVEITEAERWADTHH
ncbi:MAG TPA: hypothetical protein VFF06_28380 [Polyangia bacterium]|nr:hypothetical protein [Polyangia bacterium]